MDSERTFDELDDELTQGAARIDAALCGWLLTLAEFDRREGYARWECRSAAHFLNWRCSISLRTARDHVRVARRLEELPLVRAAFADGVLSYSKARSITRVATPETEATLVEWAKCATAAQLDKVVAGRKSVDRPEPEPRYVSSGYDDDGSFLLRARLSPEEGAVVQAAMRAALASLKTDADDAKSGSAEPFSVDAGRPSMADALVAMAETTLAHGPTPVSAGDRNMVLVVLNAETGEATLDNGVRLPEASKQQVLCGASFVKVVRGQHGEVLFLGRSSRLPNRAQRRALKLRDGGCVFPGCTQRVWVDAHHVTEWEHGGRTDIDNLVLLCRFHHTAVHHRGFRIEAGPHQTFRFFNPDGIQQVAARAPAPANGTVATVGASGAAITKDTSIPDWDGQHPNYAWAIEDLLILEGRA